MENLVIVESPSKEKTIEKYLGDSYKVSSSKGHIRDLAKKNKYGLGIELENDFKPIYENIKLKSKVISELKKLAKSAKKVILATDPDREGEAISWHLKEVLELPDDKYSRVIFNEITKDAILDAFKHQTKIDDNLVSSQETRRILDRIIGFRLSKLMQSKTSGKSAGRVQSVALKLIVDREKEIQAFIEEEYYTIKAIFNDFDAMLEKYNNKKIEIKSELEANEILKKLSKVFKIEEVTKKEVSRKSKLPFITSTLQQEASTKLNFNSKRTMMIAQKLYEGIELKNETVGLITYMRTDSTRLSENFVNKAFEYIEKEYSKKYLGVVRKIKSKQKTQDAHEAIRPTDINKTPEKVKEYLKEDEYKLYKFIYYRTLASLMKDAKVENTSVIFDNNGYKFKTTGQIILFDGYLKVYKDYEKSEENELPPFDKYKSNVLVSNDIIKEQHFTKPKPRYTEASLIKELEELGIGRPSTYSKTMETLTERSYIRILEKKMHPTEIGMEITEKLQEFFSDLINVEYTANMENDLDKIAEGDLKSTELLKEFYYPFEDNVLKAFEKMEKVVKETGELCPECNNKLIIKKSKYGEFVACSNYPTCKYIKKEKPKEVGKCPECGNSIVEKKTRKNKIFYGCSNYPTCKYATWEKP